MNRIVMISLVALASACAGSPATDNNGDTDDTEVDNGPDGAIVYADSCALCHETDGTGVDGLGPSLVDEVPGLVEADIESIVTDGTGSMNPVNLFEDEVAAVAEYVIATFGS